MSEEYYAQQVYAKQINQVLAEAERYHLEHPQSKFSTFLRGFASGAMNGAVMMGLVFALGATAALIPALAAYVPAVTNLAFLGSATFMTAVTGLFGGVMATKRAVFDRPSTHENNQGRSIVAVSSPALSQQAAPTILMADTAEQPATKSWKDQTGRQGDSQSRIQQILANGALSDKDRASAILAARETADATRTIG